MRCTKSTAGGALAAWLFLNLLPAARAQGPVLPASAPVLVEGPVQANDPPSASGAFVFGPNFLADQAPGEPPTPPNSTPEVPTRPVPLADPTSFSSMGNSPFGGPQVGHAPFRVEFRETVFPWEPVTGQATSLGMMRQDLAVAFPIYQDCANEWTTSLNARWEVLSTHAILPDTRQAFPCDLWDLRVGTTYRHLFDNGWIAGATVSVGSASDKPFHSIDEMTAGISTFLRVPQGEHNAWMFTLSYSPTGELAFPLPGVAYVWQPSEQFHANIGLPFMLMYRPVDEVTLDFSYMLLRTVHARATYRPLPGLGIYTGFDWGNESYFLADRADTNDRLFYYDMRLTAGTQVALSKHASLDFSGGYVFDRFYFEGQSYSDSNFNRVDVGNGPFVSLRGQLRW